jgi:MFS family permease
MMGFYIIFISWGNTLGPLAGGFIIAGTVSLTEIKMTCADVTGPGWRWHVWVCSIFAALNFLSVFLFVAETHFERNGDLGMQPDAASVASEKQQVQEHTIESTIPDSLERRVVDVKKTFLQDINPLSGITPRSNFFRIFVRPFPLIAYPAVCWAFLGCKFYFYSLKA